MKNKLSIALLFISISIFASDLELSEPILYTDNKESYALLNISWKNAWKTKKNNDAVWVFFKFLRENGGYNHARVKKDGHLVNISNRHQQIKMGFEVPEDHTGIFIYPETLFRGDISITVKILLDKESFKRLNTRRASFSAYGIEMVRIPDGSFMVGDTDPSSLKFGSVYKVKSDGSSAGLFKINSESQQIVISKEKGNLYYEAPEGYEGDQKGVIPKEFPKGVDGFYIMKYEPTQGQYARFLNSLSDYQSHNRANFGGKSYYTERGSIKIKHGKYYAEHPDAPCNFMSWDDAMAYADWACLRPMTEFEYTKASRGTEKPKIGKDFPWGTNSKIKLQRVVSQSGELTMLNNWDESDLSDENKDIFAASYYWVMDMAGSLWERVITIGDEKGRSFKGSEGDGKLTNYGFATNEDWPKGIEETGGFGFRGGGFYGYGRDYHDFNPYSPVSYRPYGGWSGGNRTNAYGARFVKR